MPSAKTQTKTPAEFVKLRKKIDIFMGGTAFGVFLVSLQLLGAYITSLCLRIESDVFLAAFIIDAGGGIIILCLACWGHHKSKKVTSTNDAP